MEQARANRFSAAAKACKVGDNKWRPLIDVLGRSEDAPPPLPRPQVTATDVVHGFAGKVRGMVGVEPVEGLNGKVFFSEAFKKRSDDDLEELFITGTASTTPSLAQINADWPKPWAFFKIFVASSAVFAGFLFGLLHFQNPNLIPGLIFVGSFAIPFSTLILFVELNVPRNVSLYQVCKLCVFGGIGSILISLFLYTVFAAESSWGTALAAGVLEESAKLGAVLLLMRNRRFHWTLNGLLLGAAVGAGFAAFESAGYALNAMLADFSHARFGSSSNEMLWTIAIRALLAPAAHVAWTALTAGALWRVKNGRPFDWQMLKDPRFLRVFVFVATLHFLWDAPITIPILGELLGVLAKCTLLGVSVWIVVLSYVQLGLKEVRSAQRNPARR